MAWALSGIPALASDVSGTVTNRATGKPVPGARVTVVGTDRAALTDAAGHFALSGIAAGERTIKIEAGGLVPLVLKRVPFADDRPIKVDAAMKPGILRAGEQTVTADKPSRLAQAETSRRTLTGADVKSIPGARNDPVLALTNLAGVKTGGRSGAPAIRGAGPNDNKYFIDQMPVGSPFHFGGLVSVFNANTISKVDLYAGALPARYGNAMSSVIDVETRAPRRDGIHGVLDTNLLFSELMLEGPFFPPGTGFMFAVRDSYIDTLTSRIAPAGTVFPDFTDYQAKITAAFPWSGNLEVSAIGSKDTTRVTQQGGTFGRSVGNDASTDSGFRSVGATYKQMLGDRLANRFLAAYLEPYSDTQSERTLNNGTHQFNWLFADELAWQVNDEHTVTVGGRYETINQISRQTRPDFSGFNFTPGASSSATASGSTGAGGQGGTIGGAGTSTGSTGSASGSASPSATATASGSTRVRPTRAQIDSLARTFVDRFSNQKMYQAFVEDAWKVSDPVTLYAGVHYDEFVTTKENRLAPRAGVAWRVAPETTLRLGYGQQYQFPDNTQLGGGPAGGPGNASLRASFAKDYVLGIDQQFSESLGAKLELYYRNLYGLPDTYRFPGRTAPASGSTPASGSVQPGGGPGGPGGPSIANSAGGRAMGAELSVDMTEFHGWSGSLALTVSESTRTSAQLSAPFPYEYDQPVVLNLVVVAPPIWDCVFSVKGRYASGRPYTPVVSITENDDGTVSPVRGDSNSARYPDGYLWSARLERKLGIFGLDDRLYFEVTQQHEAVGVDYGDDFANYLTPAYTFGVPPLPYLGYSIKF